MKSVPSRGAAHLELKAAGIQALGALGQEVLYLPELDEHLQLHLYGLAVQSKFGEMPRTASLLYLEKGKPMTISFDPPRMEAFQARLRDDIDRIMKEEFGPTPSYQTCRYCDYQSICEAKAVGGYRG